MSVRLGPFQLTRPVARGAMGEVWAATHSASKLPVAVKVLTGVHARDDRVRAFFRDEIRAVASLDHPHIVTLLDAGEIDPDTAAASGGALLDATPWLAMEYASDGTVGERAPTGWPDIRDLALRVLDALAHAHARGIVHRDLKPANLLWCGPRDPRPGLKLSDFGIAVWMGQVAPGTQPAGTPQYMAPEQLAGETAGVGPWTDLYSVGCLVWRLVTHALPFEGLQPMQILRAQIGRVQPRFAPVGAVPRGLEGWLRALLARRPEDRPQRAADAAAALVAIDPGGTSPESRIWRELHERESTVELVTLEEGATEDTSAPISLGFVGPPPGIPDWRTPATRRPPALVGAGLGLFGLREPPVLGRVVEQALLWDELRAAAESRAPRLVVVSGPAGVGRTRLGRWLCTRADELGAGRILWSEGGVRGGLAATAVRMLRCGGLAGEARRQQIAAAIRSPELRLAAEALVDDRLGDDVRAEVCARVLLAVGGERTTLLCLDDGHRAEEDLDVIAAIQRTSTGALVVLLIDDAELASAPALERRLAGLPGLRIPLGPLAPAAMHELAGALAWLDSGLAAELEERAAGLPGVALEIVAGWVGSGALVPTPAGHVLRSGTPTVPSAAGGLDRVLAALPAGCDRALALAGALGPEVPLPAWTGADPRADEIARVLVGLRLAADEDAVLTLHPRLATSLLERARRAPDWPRIAAEAVALLPTGDPRRGRLLVEAGRPSEGLDALLDAVEHAVGLSARRGLASWAEARRAADACGAAPTDPRVERLAVARIRLDVLLGDLGAAEQGIAAALARVVDPAQRVSLRILELELCVSRGDRVGAAAALAAVRGRAADPTDAGRILLAEAEITPDPTASLRLLEEARERWLQAGLPAERLARITWRQARRSRATGDLGRARTQLERVVADLQARGDATLRGSAQAALAEVLVRLGEARRAEQAARRSLASFEAVGAPPVEAKIALGLALVATGDLDEACIALEDAARLALRGERPTALRQAALGRALAHASAGTWALVHDRLKEAERAAADPDPVSGAIAREVAAVCHRGGFPQLGARARALGGEPG